MDAVCTDCGKPYGPGPFGRNVCDDCVKKKHDWFWEIWDRTESKDDETVGVRSPA